MLRKRKIILARVHTLLRQLHIATPPDEAAGKDRSIHAAQDVVLSFGKHKGKSIRQVDDAYLWWMQVTLASPWKKLASQVLLYRKQQEAALSRKRQLALLTELRDIGNTRNLQRGKVVHAEAVERRDDSCIYVATALLNMYAKCRSMVDARQVFDSIKHPDVVCWNALILGYAENGDGNTALDLFAKMTTHGYSPTRLTFVACLKACTSLAMKEDASERAKCLERGKQLHSRITCHSDLYIQSSLIDMYAKCGSMLHARQVFGCMKQRDVVSWTALILGYAANGEGMNALDMFGRMKIEGCAPDSLTYVAALKACITLAQGKERTYSLERGKEIHTEIGCCLDYHIQNALMNMYAKCGSMAGAREMFDSIKHPNVVTWNSLILGYVENGECVSALDLFSRMKARGCPPDWMSCYAVFKASTALGSLETGKRMHAQLNARMERHAMLVTSLVDFYAKCGSLLDAQKVFDSQPETRDASTWTALMAGYSRLGDDKTVFQLLKGMQDAGCKLNGVAFACILECCSHAGLVEKAGEVLKAMSTEHGIVPCVEHYNCMVDVLGRSNKLNEALALLRSMPCRPDTETWMALLKACRKNVDVARLAFKTLVSLDDRNATAYVLMAQIYGSLGMWKDQEIVLLVPFLRHRVIG